MIDPFAKAEQWRARATELRKLAGRMHEREARAGLVAMAEGLEHHARSLIGMALKLHCAGKVFRRHATETVPEGDMAEAAD